MKQKIELKCVGQKTPINVTTVFPLIGEVFINENGIFSVDVEQDVLENFIQMDFGFKFELVIREKKEEIKKEEIVKEESGTSSTKDKFDTMTDSEIDQVLSALPKDQLSKLTTRKKKIDFIKKNISIE